MKQNLNYILPYKTGSFIARKSSNAMRYLFLFFMQTAFAAFSQKQHIRFEHLGTSAGLSQSNVMSVFQDSRGFMWFGTEDGLNRYDGYNFKVYKNDPEKHNSISGNYINGIVEDTKGDLWIATWGGGLNKFDREKNHFVNYKHNANNSNSISSNFVSCLLKDDKGNIWMSVDGGGINVLDVQHNRFTKYTNYNSTLSDSTIVTIYEDSRHNIWLGTNSKGLFLFDAVKNSFKNFDHQENDPQSLSNNKVNTIFEDSKHRLWVGTDNGLNLFNGQTGNFKVYRKEKNSSNTLCDDLIFSIAEDDEGMIWIGSENNGISVYNPEKEIFNNYQYSDFSNTDLNSNSINKIYKDNRGNIWIGTYNAGINLVARNANEFTHYKHTSSGNSLSNNNVLSFCEDNENNLLIATDGGGLDLYNKNTGNFIHHKYEDGNKKTIAGNNVMSVLRDSYGKLWVGTYGNGVTVINTEDSSYRHYQPDPANPYSLTGSNGWSIYEDREKNIWIASSASGVSLYDRMNDRFIRYTADKYGLTGNDIISIYEDKDGFMWFGTDHSGLNKLDKKTNKVTQIKHADNNKNGLSSNSVSCFCEDENGNLWIGTNGGLNCLNKKTSAFTNYGKSDGLPHEKIVGILKDDTGNLWISTRNGISKFNLKSKIFRNYGVADGLQGNEFNQACYKSSSGLMYFGGNNGFNEFDPYKIKQDAFEPPLVITNFQIFNEDVAIASNSGDHSPLKKDISETKEITLSYKNSVFSFEFASLNYTSQEKKQYSYMLEGFDNNWNNIGTKHSATYTNLDPGRYVFKVRSLNNEGEWSSNIASIQLTIKPPFWLTWWFRSLAMLIIIGGAISFYKFRINIIQAQKRKLQHKVDEQTRQLTQSAAEEKKARQEAERARLETDEANKDLERKNKELEEFAYVASHDLQEPLRTTSSFVDLLQKQYKGRLDEKADKYFTYILEASDRMKGLIKNLLDYSRIGNKKELEEVDCDKTLNNVLADLSIAISEAGAIIKHEPLPVITGYPTELKQLFQNLVTNAIKFRKKDTCPEIDISVKKIDGYWQFAFKDNGIGIEEKHNEKIFVIFQRLHTRAEYEGTGIGLSHCKKIVELHKGRIWVESKPGIGSTFNFTIKEILAA